VSHISFLSLVIIHSTLVSTVTMSCSVIDSNHGYIVRGSASLLEYKRLAVEHYKYRYIYARMLLHVSVLTHYVPVMP
jgi:hypothetical protein